MKLPNIQINKILYATDLSESAVHAFSYAVSLANMYGAGITILHVLAEIPGEEFITNMIDSGTWNEIKARHYSEARDQLIGKKRDNVAIKEVLQAFSEEAKADESKADEAKVEESKTDDTKAAAEADERAAIERAIEEARDPDRAAAARRRPPPRG